MTDELSRASYWDQRYVDKKSGWDNRRPHPYIENILPLIPQLEKKRVLVIGAGPGHDAALWAERSCEVVALDFSREAEKSFTAYYPASRVHYVVGDFFAFAAKSQPFDVVFEHTLLCAIAPGRYADYFQAVRNNLASGGLYAAVIWNQTPMGENGPPFSVANTVVEKYLQDGFEILQKETVTDTIPGREGTETFFLARKIS